MPQKIQGVLVALAGTGVNRRPFGGKSFDGRPFDGGSFDAMPKVSWFC
jgi:hypothetical protein